MAYDEIFVNNCIISYGMKRIDEGMALFHNLGIKLLYVRLKL
jgi:hypothetical protein